MKKTLILSALMAVAVTFMSCTSDTDDGISPAVLVSLQQQQEAEQELYKKNEKVSGIWICEYNFSIGLDGKEYKTSHTMKLSKNGKGTNSIIYTPEMDLTETIVGRKIDKEEENFSYELDIENNKITFPYVIDEQINGKHYHEDYTLSVNILELTDTTLKIQIIEYNASSCNLGQVNVFGAYSKLPEITTWTKLQ